MVRSITSLTARGLAQVKRDQRGNVAIIFAIALPIVVGGAGLAVETSFDYVSQSRLQSAADAAAYASAIEVIGGSDANTINGAASQQATSNGWAAAKGTLTVNTPPSSGPNAGKVNAVEVRLTQTAPRFFTAYFSSAPVSLNARAVALTVTAANACILALNKTAAKSVQVQGNSTLTLTGCDIMSDSVADDALNVWGNAHLTADCAISVGGVTNKAGMTLTACPSAITQAPRAADPFAYVPAPSPGATQSIPKNPKGPVSLNPGSYTSGMSLSGDITLNPGIYYVSGGDFSIAANANISGSGVTIYLVNGSHANMNGNATVNLQAPTSGTYSGILFFGDRNGTGSNIFNGDASSGLTGDLYFPTQAVSYLGNFSGINGCTQIIGDTVAWSGNTTVSVDCAAQGMQKIPATQSIKLVE
ncbi:MAG: pilus assembly protein TadG-related protein [Phenylobacterium sp.]